MGGWAVTLFCLWGGRGVGITNLEPPPLGIIYGTAPSVGTSNQSWAKFTATKSKEPYFQYDRSWHDHSELPVPLFKTNGNYFQDEHDKLLSLFWQLFISIHNWEYNVCFQTQLNHLNARELVEKDDSLHDLYQQKFQKFKKKVMCPELVQTYKF